MHNSKQLLAENVDNTIDPEMTLILQLLTRMEISESGTMDNVLKDEFLAAKAAEWKLKFKHNNIPIDLDLHYAYSYADGNNMTGRRTSFGMIVAERRKMTSSDAEKARHAEVKQTSKARKLTKI